MAQFDQYGRLIRNSPRPIPINTVPYHTNISGNGSDLGLWERFDNFIRRIGNWFAVYSENITGLIAIVICAIGAIMFISWLISLGLFWGIIAGVFLGGIVYYAVLIVAGIFIFLGNIALGIIRYIFYNGWTFLISLAILLGFIFFGNYTHQSYTSSQSVEKVTSSYPTTTYVCTARTSLKVRRYPTLTSSQIGSLYREEEVEVLDILDGFAHVKLNGQDGYASVKYLRKK